MPVHPVKKTKKPSKSKEPTAPTTPKVEGVVGEVVSTLLAAVKPNTWNPVVFTDRQLTSLREGLKEDGWLASQALLVWGTDEEGNEKNIIIDGEHRYRCAQALGFVHGPAVFLHGLTEVKAKALTIKINKKRGTFDDALLADLLKEVMPDFSEDFDSALSFGFDEDEFAKLTAMSDEDESPVGVRRAGGKKASGESEDAQSETPSLSTVRLVQLYFTKEQHETFLKRMDTIYKLLQVAEGTTMTDVMYRMSGIVAGDDPEMKVSLAEQ